MLLNEHYESRTIVLCVLILLNCPKRYHNNIYNKRPEIFVYIYIFKKKKKKTEGVKSIHEQQHL